MTTQKILEALDDITDLALEQPVAIPSSPGLLPTILAVLCALGAALFRYVFGRRPVPVPGGAVPADRPKSD